MTVFEPNPQGMGPFRRMARNFHYRGWELPWTDWFAYLAVYPACAIVTAVATITRFGDDSWPQEAYLNFSLATSAAVITWLTLRMHIIVICPPEMLDKVRYQPINWGEIRRKIRAIPLSADGMLKLYTESSTTTQGYLLFIPLFVFGLIIKAAMAAFGPFSVVGIVIGVGGLVVLLAFAGLIIKKFVDTARS